MAGHEDRCSSPWDVHGTRRIQRLATEQRRGIFSVKEVSDRLMYASARDGDGIDNIEGVGRRFAVRIAFDFRATRAKLSSQLGPLSPSGARSLYPEIVIGGEDVKCVIFITSILRLTSSPGTCGASLSFSIAPTNELSY
jgi:hypothetical protein